MELSQVVSATTTLNDASLPTLESIFYLVYLGIQFVTGAAANSDLEAIRESLISFGQVFRGVSAFVSLVLFSGAVYSIVRTMQIRVEDSEEAESGIFPEAKKTSGGPPGRDRWQKVLSHASSENPSDRRLAILEADIILEDLLEHLDYHGETIGDKLKSAEGSAFRTLNAAWEAHKIRNVIAHEGTEFEMPEREARRVVGLFESVFKEFDFI